jgi:hypothetical protein
METVTVNGRLRHIRADRKTRRVLTVLLTGATNIGGSTIWRLTGGMSGNVYLVLAWLEAADPPWVDTRWETVPEGEDRPRRRFYTLTPYGRIRAAKLLGLEGI